MTRLAIVDIRLDATLQPRAAINDDTIQQYAECMRDGVHFPPVIVFYDGETYWLADGYHRMYAARQVGRTHIDAAIHEGQRDAAEWFSFGVNTTHGLRRTRADVQRTVEAALRHPSAASLNNVQLGRHCGVDESTIRRARAILGNAEDNPQASVMSGGGQTAIEVTRNGTTYTMQTGGIGTAGVVPPHAAGVYTLPEWTALGEAEQANIIDAALTAPTKKKMNKQTGENIEWARWSWNPVTGCYHGCVYCYARDIANRYYAHGFDAALMADRLAIPRFQRPGPEAAHAIGYRNIFTCSMADLFGKWVPQPWIDAVLGTVRACPEWNFLFLTKFPIRLAEQSWPDNAWVGCSVDTQARVSSAERAFSKVKAGIKWLSCEPLLEPLKFQSLEMFDWIVIGGQSKSSQAPEFHPPWDWVSNLVEQARAAGCKVYFKTNLIVFPKEYPFEHGDHGR